MRSAGHREIEHTADLGFELWAPERASLYEEAVKALGDLCYERAAVRPRQGRRLKVRGDSPEELLIRWLQEMYLQVEADMWLTAAAGGVVVDGGAVVGTLRGEPYDPERHTLHTEIKAITYHGMAIRRDGGLWRATVVVDV